ncbi:MAG TPA: sulfate ABC transporter substrate-binding protein [Longimicrobiales bacterium]|nr:sulfate ABC transporter substrate-binding protein [Longimicrobiales bacterium]
MRKRHSPGSALLLAAVTACAPGTADDDATGARTLTLGVYTTPREVYAAVKPQFSAAWQARTGAPVTFRDSYLGSGAQSRAIAGGFEADVAALSLEPDIARLVEAGLVDAAWKEGAHRGMVSRSIVVLGVRAGNPLAIRDWDDLARAGVEVLTPNPRTSGGAMWNIAALYGAALRGPTRAPGDTAAADDLLRRVLANVSVMDKGARESMLTFEAGVGDVIITYENEIIAAQRAGQAVDYVIPRSTILIENPAVVVDRYAAAHGNAEVAAAFVAFLASDEVQRLFADHGYRPVSEAVALERSDRFPPVTDLFTIRDLGDWSAAVPALFGAGGAFDRATARVASQ